MTSAYLNESWQIPGTCMDLGRVDAIRTLPRNVCKDPHEIVATEEADCKAYPGPSQSPTLRERLVLKPVVSNPIIASYS